MNIGIIGSGNIGGAFAQICVSAGHRVSISNSRGAASLEELVAKLGNNAQATSVEAAATVGDVVLIAIPFGKFAALPKDALRAKIVVDANNYFPGRDGRFDELDRGKTTSSELVAKHLSESRLVKAFNTIYFEHLRTQGNPTLPLDQRRAIFVAGDDAEAKKVVSTLIESLGFGAVDTGGLRDGGKRQQPDGTLFNKVLSVREAMRLVG